MTVLQIFLHGIAPQTEDEANKGYIRLEIRKNKLSDEKLQNIWQTLVLDCVTGNIPGLDDKDEGLTGIRLVQKPQNFRIEVWTKGTDEKLEVYQHLKSYLEGNIVEDVVKDKASDYKINLDKHQKYGHK